MHDREGDRKEVTADAETRGGGGGEAAERKEELVGGGSSKGRGSRGGQEHQEVLDGK